MFLFSLLILDCSRRTQCQWRSWRPNNDNSQRDLVMRTILAFGVENGKKKKPNDLAKKTEEKLAILFQMTSWVLRKAQHPFQEFLLCIVHLCPILPFFFVSSPQHPQDPATAPVSYIEQGHSCLLSLPLVCTHGSQVSPSGHSRFRCWAWWGHNSCMNPTDVFCKTCGRPQMSWPCSGETILWIWNFVPGQRSRGAAPCLI